MTEIPHESPDDPAAARAAALAERVLAKLDQHVLGQRPAAEMLLATYMAGGHALLEGVPGIGKTLLARALAGVLGLDFHRVQFTPDLMPSDVVGTNILESGGPAGGPSGAPGSRFRLVKGPVFTQILMADEINRTPPKTQSALLEAMQELQVTIDGERHALPGGFFVIATQNPVEFEGTYPLPEAQLDRFLTRVEMVLPPPEEELTLFRLAVKSHGRYGHDDLPSPLLEPAEALALRQAAHSVRVADELLHYLAALTAGLRASRHLELAISPRGALALLQTARGHALIEGRDFLLPDDLKRCLLPCWEHRLILSAEAELEGHNARRLLADLAAAVEVPKR